MALDGMSCRKIAATLNEEGVPTPAPYCGWNMGRKGPYAGLDVYKRQFPQLGIRFIAINYAYDSLTGDPQSDSFVIPFKNLSLIHI